MATQKYFIAIVPPGPVSAGVMAVKQHMADIYASKGALRSPAHITLHMPFEYDDAKEAKLTDCLHEFKFDSEVAIRLNDYSCFEPRVIFIDVVKSPPLLQLQQSLVQHVKARLHIYNQAESLRGFHPHITVAFRDLKKPSFYTAWEAFKKKDFRETFICTQIALLKSDGGIWKVHQLFDFTRASH